MAWQAPWPGSARALHGRWPPPTLSWGAAWQVRPAISDRALLRWCHNQGYNQGQLGVAAEASAGAHAQPGMCTHSSAGPLALPASSAGPSSDCGTQLQPHPQAWGHGLPCLPTFFLTAKGWLSGSSSLSMSTLVTMSLQQQCRRPMSKWELGGLCWQITGGCMLPNCCDANAFAATGLGLRSWRLPHPCRPAGTGMSGSLWMGQVHSTLPYLSLLRRFLAASI